METTKKLPQEFKVKLIAALRSGEYKQGNRVMYNPASDTLCCLAVAGVICGLQKESMSNVDILVIDKWWDSTLNPTKVSASKEAKDLGYPIMLMGGGSDYAQKLAEMNDGGKSFSEIADYIEANL